MSSETILARREARRRKILENSENRLNRITGKSTIKLDSGNKIRHFFYRAKPCLAYMPRFGLAWIVFLLYTINWRSLLILTLLNIFTCMSQHFTLQWGGKVHSQLPKCIANPYARLAQLSSSSNEHLANHFP